MPSGSTRAYVQEFVYPADQGIKQAFSQAWKRNRIPAHPWPGRNFALWKILLAAGIAHYKRRREISINPTQINIGAFEWMSSGMNPDVKAFSFQ